jgi:hypothetical protein
MCEFYRPVLTFPIIHDCIHPAMTRIFGYDRENIMELVRCPKEDYSLIEGVPVDLDILENYIQKVKYGFHVLRTLPEARSQMLDQEREDAHDRVLEDSGQERYSPFDYALKKLVEKRVVYAG